MSVMFSSIVRDVCDVAASLDHNVNGLSFEMPVLGWVTKIDQLNSRNEHFLDTYCRMSLHQFPIDPGMPSHDLLHTHRTQLDHDRVSVSSQVSNEQLVSRLANPRLETNPSSCSRHS